MGGSLKSLYVRLVGEEFLSVGLKYAVTDIAYTHLACPVFMLQPEFRAFLVSVPTKATLLPPKLPTPIHLNLQSLITSAIHAEVFMVGSATRECWY